MALKHDTFGRINFLLNTEDRLELDPKCCLLGYMLKQELSVGSGNKVRHFQSSHELRCLAGLMRPSVECLLVFLDSYKHSADSRTCCKALPALC